MFLNNNFQDRVIFSVDKILVPCTLGTSGRNSAKILEIPHTFSAISGLLYIIDLVNY